MCVSVLPSCGLRAEVRWGGGVNINFQKNGNVLIFCLILQSKIFLMFEARSTKHEARSTKHEARSTKHEARSTKLLLCAVGFPVSRGICAKLSSYGK